MLPYHDGQAVQPVSARKLRRSGFLRNSKSFGSSLGKTGNPVACPACSVPYGLVFIEHPRFGNSQQPRIAAVTDGIKNISYEAITSNALDRRGCEKRAKTCVIQARQIGKPRRTQFISRVIGGIGGCARKLVPRTHRKTIVTTINTIAECSAKL